MDCIYSITQPNGTIIELQLKDVRLYSYVPDVSFFSWFQSPVITEITDYLEIRDGSSQDSKVIEKLSGEYASMEPLWSTQNNMWIR